MQESLTPFSSPEFGTIRAVTLSGEPWLVGKDVAQALGYSNPRDALSKHVDEEDKHSVAFRDGTSGNPNMTVINESGLYSLVLSSKLPTAKKFRRWVTAEVLPSIRKTGGYLEGQQSMTDSELLAKALLVAHRQIEERTRQIETLQPKALFADAVTASHSSILVGDLSKILKQNGVEIGQNRLFQWLRENGYLIRAKGASWNMPTQRAMEQHLFEVEETIISHSDGHTSISRTVKVTGKGQVFFVNKFLGASPT